MLPAFYLLSLVSFSLAATVRPTSTASSSKGSPLLKDILDGIKAIVPTASGQIGINPVETDLGDASTYIGVIASTDTKYITIGVDDYTTRWIGVNTEFLDVTTVNPTSTSTAFIKVATATAAADGQSIGDISVLLPEGLASALGDAVKSSVDVCQALKRRSVATPRRQNDAVMSCLIGQASKYAADGGIFEAFGGATEWGAFTLKVAEEALGLLHDMIAGVTVAVANKKILFMALVGAALYAIGVEGTYLAATDQPSNSPPIPQTGYKTGKVNIPADGLAAPLIDKKCSGTEKKNDFSPICPDSRCQGDNSTGLCSVFPNKRCPCYNVGYLSAPTTGNQSYFEAQQELLASMAAMPNPVANCTITSTVYAASQSQAVTGTFRHCQCASTFFVGLELATSGSSTTTYCKSSGYSIPTGFTKIPAVNGLPLTNNVPSASKTSSPAPAPTCDDACKLNKGNPCNCGESGCDENSPRCCGNASCPVCDCGESSCSPTSPWCCASNTCQWSKTGGGGGWPASKKRSLNSDDSNNWKVTRPMSKDGI